MSYLGDLCFLCLPAQFSVFSRQKRSFVCYPSAHSFATTNHTVDFDTLRDSLWAMRSEFAGDNPVAISVDFECKVPVDVELFGLVTIPLSRWDEVSGAVDLVALAAAARNETRHDDSAGSPVSVHTAVYDQRLRGRRTLLEADDDDDDDDDGDGDIASEHVPLSQQAQTSIQGIMRSIGGSLKSASDQLDVWQSIMSQWDNSVLLFNRVRSESS